MSLCALAAGAACSGGSGAAPSSVPAESTVASSSVATTTTAELRILPYPLVDENEDGDAQVRVRFIAYGDVDPNDDIDFGIIPDVRIAVIDDRELSDWWDTIRGDNFSEPPRRTQLYIPPGVQVQSTVEDIAASPIGFITTGPDGTAETYLNPSEHFSICVVSPVAASIAGCSLRETTGQWREMVFYLYFSRGRAYIENGQDGDERYRRFLYGQDSYDSSDESATITFISTDYTGEYSTDDLEGKYLSPGAEVIVINDTDIDAWWAAVFDNEVILDNGRNPLGASSSASGSASGDPASWELGWASYDREVRERVRKNASIRTLVIDWPGIIEISLSPGDYLFCDLRNSDTGYGIIIGCDYVGIVAAQVYMFEVNYGIWKLSDEGRKLLEDAKNWDFTP